MRLLPIALLALAGCASRPAAIEVRTVEVVRETMVPCPVETPARPALIGQLPPDARDAVLVMAAKLLEWSGPGGYADQAEAALAICAHPTTTGRP